MTLRRSGMPASTTGCPKLGLPGDPRTHYAYATPGHRCWAGRNPADVRVTEQEALCLTAGHRTCRRYLRAIGSRPMSTPPGDEAVAGAAGPPAATDDAADTWAWSAAASAADHDAGEGDTWIPDRAAPSAEGWTWDAAAGPPGAPGFPALPQAGPVTRPAPAARPAATAGPAPLVVSTGPIRRRSRVPRLIALLVLPVVFGLLAFIGFQIAAGRFAGTAPGPTPGASGGPAASAAGTASPTPAPTASVTRTSQPASPAPTPTPGPTATPSPAPATVTYRVRAGDSLTSIARRFGVTVEAIQKANNIGDPDQIEIGQRLAIPARTATPKP